MDANDKFSLGHDEFSTEGIDWLLRFALKKRERMTIDIRELDEEIESLRAQRAEMVKEGENGNS